MLSFRARHCSIINRRSSASAGTKSPDFSLGCFPGPH